jgi:hypothetical protein
MKEGREGHLPVLVDARIADYFLIFPPAHTFVVEVCDTQTLFFPPMHTSREVDFLMQPPAAFTLSPAIAPVAQMRRRSAAVRIFLPNIDLKRMGSSCLNEVMWPLSACVHALREATEWRHESE